MVSSDDLHANGKNLVLYSLTIVTHLEFLLLPKESSTRPKTE